jgi:hypothetical protein
MGVDASGTGSNRRDVDAADQLAGTCIQGFMEMERE